MKKLWGQVTDTAVTPPPPRVKALAVEAIVAALGVLAVTGAAEVVQAIVDWETKISEDFDAQMTRANSVLLYTLEPKDVIVIMMLPSPPEKWDKLATNNAAVSAQMAIVARSQFNDFRMRDGNNAIEQSTDLIMLLMNASSKH